MERLLKNSTLQVICGASAGLALDNLFPASKHSLDSPAEAVKVSLEVVGQVAANVVLGGIVSSALDLSFGVSPVENAPFLLPLVGFQSNLLTKMKQLGKYTRSLYSNFTLVLVDEDDEVDNGIQSVERDPAPSNAKKTTITSTLLDQEFQ
jgi:hypothetical protein